ncbi:MAG: restriction endonuclease [Nitrospirota bacterium]
MLFFLDSQGAPTIPQDPSQRKGIIGKLTTLLWGENVQEKEKYDRACAVYKTVLREWSLILQANRERENENLAKQEWESLHHELQFNKIDTMTGNEFEHLLSVYFAKEGYQVKTTGGAGDQGADLILKRVGPPNEYIVVQAKRSSSPISNKAIQELLGGMLFHKCSKGIVVTTSSFTKGATALAVKDRRISLWDRAVLEDRLAPHFQVPIPPFSMEEYRRIKEILLKSQKPSTERRFLP